MEWLNKKLKAEKEQHGVTMASLEDERSQSNSLRQDLIVAQTECNALRANYDDAIRELDEGRVKLTSTQVLSRPSSLSGHPAGVL